MRTALLVVLAAASALAGAQAPIVAYYGRTTAAAQIFGAPSAKAKAIGRLGGGQSVVIRPAGRAWYGVVMSTGRLAYVPAQAVSVPLNAATNQPYGYTQAQLRAQMAPRRRSTAGLLASRGASVPRGTADARTQMAANAMTWEGTTPYKWGGTQLGSGIDCSGFVQKMAGAIGMRLPRTAAEQAMVGMPITRYEDLRAGDRLYFWDAKRGKIGHTGIYVGGGQFTHSSSGHHGIATDVLTERWRRICVAARR